MRLISRWILANYSNEGHKEHRAVITVWSQNGVQSFGQVSYEDQISIIEYQDSLIGIQWTSEAFCIKSLIQKPS